MAEQTAQEPTMEEILASIRRIISEDDAPAKPAAELAAAPSPLPITADSEDVLELTERAEPSPFAQDAAAEPAPKRARKSASPFARFEKGGEEDAPEYDDSRFDAGGMFDAKGDLDFMAADTDAVPPPAPPPEPEPQPQSAVRAQPAPQPEPQPQPVQTPMRDSDEGLLSKPAAATVASAFGALSRNVPMPAPGRSLEDLVKEMMKPMLADWLDQNLTQIVETKVQAEVERLSRQI